MFDANKVPVYSPHAWGLTTGASTPLQLVSVFPTGVGINRTVTRWVWQARAYSPRAWGLTGFVMIRERI